MIVNSIEIALEAHHGQKDKSDLPYIIHHLRVMLGMHTLEEMIIAVLHDVLEDSKINEDYLIAKGISRNSIKTLKLLTKSNGDYSNYIKNLKSDPVAVKIKEADIIDNMNITRPKTIDTDDVKRLNNYINALMLLGGEVK